MEIKLGKKTYTLKYGYKATVKSGLLTEMQSLMKRTNVGEDVGQEGGNLEQLEVMLEEIAKLVLIGLQTKHGNEFGYDYEDKKAEEKQIDKIIDLLDEYFEEEDADVIELFNQLQEEMFKNGFLAKVLKGQD